MQMMFRGMFNPVLGRSNEKDRARENGYFSIPLQREGLAAEYLQETYRELMIVALFAGIVAGLVALTAMAAAWQTAFIVASGLTVLLFGGAGYLAIDRMMVTRRIALDVHQDRAMERETFRETEDMYSVALAHYLRFKEGQAFDIKQLELFHDMQKALLAAGGADANGFDYGKDNEQ